MKGLLLYVLLSVACFRTWRLIGRDDITAPFRDWFGDRFKADSKLLLLLTCEWCLGTWLSLVAVYSTHRYVVPLEPHWLLWAVAVAGSVGFLGSIDAKLNE